MLIFTGFKLNWKTGLINFISFNGNHCNVTTKIIFLSLFPIKLADRRICSFCQRYTYTCKLLADSVRLYDNILYICVYFSFILNLLICNYSYNTRRRCITDFQSLKLEGTILHAYSYTCI